MKLRRLLWVAPVLGAAACGLIAERYLQAAAPVPEDPQLAGSLPISRVVLFNSGVGYFSREGVVEDESRIDLTFQERDINDLLKSMTLQDRDGGFVSAVAYDSREPIDRTLSSFAVNLNNNPSLSQILNQTRGEKIEVALQPTAQAQPGLLNGVNVGIEKQKLPSGPNQSLECDVLNILTADGLRSVKMPEVLRVKFANPALESDLRRALDTLALSHDAQKKAVSIQFSGQGKRRVQVGYVMEAPIWKTTYRLALAEDGLPQIQAWAVVENTTDEDWHDIRMALVSGRPISFKMDMYNPLYVPRPTVEPELFASLRPPTYRGGFTQMDDPREQLERKADLDGLDANARRESQLRGRAAATPQAASRPLGLAAPGEKSYEAEGYARDKEVAKRLGAELAEQLQFSAVRASAEATQLGDVYQYLIGHTVSLPRQKSAMLPILPGNDIEATRLSIYNPQVQAKHPLLGLRIKNTTGTNLSQGPITVYEGSTYAGDGRILDVQKDEERLVAYAIDLGTEVDPQVGSNSSRVTSVKANKGIITTVTKQIEERKYRIANRSDKDRTLLIEHPNRTNQQFKLVDTKKPVEDTPEFWRFEVPVKAGKEETFLVKEERESPTSYTLTNTPDNTIRYVISLNEASPELKAKLQEALKLKGDWDKVRRDQQTLQTDLNRLNQDQERIRRNLRETPNGTPLFQTYLDKLTAQEKEIDELTEKQKQLIQLEARSKEVYEDYLVTISD